MPRPTLKTLQATVSEQEATILRLRGENSLLLARLAAMRKRKHPLSSPSAALARLGAPMEVANAFMGRRRSRIPLPKARSRG